MKKEFEIKPPLMPNFVRFSSGESFHISKFTEQEAKEFGELMKQTFIKHWRDSTKSIPVNSEL